MLPSLRLLKLLPMLGIAASLAAADFSVEPSGIRIVAPSYKDENTMRAFNHSPGTCLAFTVLLHSPDRHIIKVNYPESHIQSATDNTGRDLLTADPVERRNVEDRKEFSSHDTISPDHKAALIQTGVFDSLALPSPKASEISLGATVVVLTGGEQQAFETNFESSVGSSFEAGKLKFTAQKIDPEGGYGRTPYRLDFRIDGPVNSIADIQFFGSSGKVIERQPQLQPGYRSTGKDAYHTLTIRLAQTPPENTRVRISLWSSTEEVVVPVEVNYRLGLPSPSETR